MARPALSAARSIDIVDFLSAMPDSAFMMSQIARATGINVGSCHAILHELNERGYVVRDPTVKTYMLGPALVAMGNAAMRSQPLIVRAQAAADAMSREHGIPMSLARMIGREVVILFSAPGPGGLRPGTRLPLLPPIGAPFLAWSSEEVIADWFASRTDGSDKDREQWAHALGQVRKWGYQVLQRSATPESLPRLLAELSTGGRLSNYKHQVTDFVKASGGYFIQPGSSNPMPCTRSC